jgi:hypothetical protein
MAMLKFYESISLKIIQIIYSTFKEQIVIIQF